MDNSYIQINDIALKYNSNKIYIVGKGSSLDSINTEYLKDSVIININDSGLIVPGDITIFHKEWVIESLESKGYCPSLYITDIDQTLSIESKALHLKFRPFSLDERELFIFQYINDKQLYIEEILFITAIKVCSFIAKIKQSIQEVYFLGFDFETAYSRKILSDFSNDDINYKSTFIRNQEFYFIELLNLYKEALQSDLHLFHIGNKVYSSLTTEKFNQLFYHKKVQIKIHEPLIEEKKNKDLTAFRISSKVKIVAEFTNNHLGDIDRLKKMVLLAKKAGANLIKVQKRDVDSFYSPDQLSSYYLSPFGKTLGDYRRGVELNEEGFKELDKCCKELDIKWFASILDYNSFVFLKNLFDIDLLKIPSTISNHEEFHRRLAEEYKGDIVISTGFTNDDYEQIIFNSFKRNSKIYLLQCTSAYPTPPYECNIAVVRHYSQINKTNCNIIPGYSSHDLGSLGSMMAVAAGAEMIEKHVRLDNTEWVHFDNVAMDLGTSEFENFVRDIRLAEKMCGDEIKKITESENHKYFYKG
jgi:N-acetylneuraminate synthase